MRLAGGDAAITFWAMKLLARLGRGWWLLSGLSVSAAVAGALVVAVISNASGFQLAGNRNAIQFVAELCAHAFSGGGTIQATPVALQGREVTYALKIEHGHLPSSMRLIRVTQGDVVRLELTSDERHFVHFHGYEIQTEVSPGKITKLMFTAGLTGRFPIHLHAGDLDDTGHEDILANIEVYPR
jgi:FtsP/CotA-like multicopper oxidase with cupredoxin domain